MDFVLASQHFPIYHFSGAVSIESDSPDLINGKLITQLSVFAFRGGVRLALLTLSRRFSFAKALVDNINNTSLTPSAPRRHMNCIKTTALK